MTPFSAILRNIRETTHFFFLRHGESLGNVRGQMQGHEDLELTEAGRAQALAAGRWFRDQQVPIGKIFTSPLRRASKTAEIIRSENRYPREETLETLKELNLGAFSGMTIPEIRDRYPTEFSRFTEESWEAVPGAERISSLSERALRVWERLTTEANSGVSHILSVTHGGFLQWLLKTSFGIPGTNGWIPLIKASNCSIFLFIARPAGNGSYYGQWSLMNYVPGELPDLGEQFYAHNR